jgi:hypothetical protein
MWTRLVWFKIGKAESTYEIVNEPSGSMKCWESTEWVLNVLPLDRYSAPQG